MYDILTIGAGTRDVFLLSDQFVFIESSQFETGVGECVALGSKIELDTIVHSTGGGATNAAATFSRLGFNTAVFCKVGDDGVGRDLIIDLQREGIVTTLIQRVAGGITGYSTLLTTSSGERTVLVYRGVSGEFKKDDIPWKELNARWIYLTSLGGNFTLSANIIRQAAKKQTRIAWNPGRREIDKGMSAFRPLLKHLSVINMNREEAERLTKKKDLPSMFRTLAVPNTIVIITDGANGAYAHENGRTWFAGTRDVRSISRTGAGDAFGSGFIAGYIHTHDIEKSLAIGTLNAESVIRQLGAKAGLLRTWPNATQIKNIPIKTV